MVERKRPPSNRSESASHSAASSTGGRDGVADAYRAARSARASRGCRCRSPSSNARRRLPVSRMRRRPARRRSARRRSRTARAAAPSVSSPRAGPRPRLRGVAAHAQRRGGLADRAEPRMLVLDHGAAGQRLLVLQRPRTSLTFPTGTPAASSARTHASVACARRSARAGSASSSSRLRVAAVEVGEARVVRRASGRSDRRRTAAARTSAWRTATVIQPSAQRKAWNGTIDGCEELGRAAAARSPRSPPTCRVGEQRERDVEQRRCRSRRPRRRGGRARGRRATASAAT